jgi:hypothetical protein
MELHTLMSQLELEDSEFFSMFMTTWDAIYESSQHVVKPAKYLSNIPKGKARNNAIVWILSLYIHGFQIPVVKGQYAQCRNN